jgi:alkylation response protein AidB-like acyl-CoA dehydrogenase
MTLETSDEIQRELSAAVLAYTTKEMGAARARRASEQEGGFERARWKVFADMGWIGILVPETYGGLGLGFGEMAAVARGLAESLMPEPFTACAVLAARTLLHGENEQLKHAVLPAICSGDLLPAVAWQEAAGVLDPGYAATVVSAASGKASQLSGVKKFVPYGAQADAFIVSARNPDGIGLYWVDANAAGVTVEHTPLADGTSQATVTFSNVSIGAEQVVSAPGAAPRALARALDEARVVAAAELLGVCSGCLDVTLEYLRTRSQFGKLIGTFQALQHRAVDLYIMKEFSVSAVNAAVAAFDGQFCATPLGAIASRAQARCSASATAIVREAIQMHGAIGWTDECDVGLYVKRALVLSAWLGNAGANRGRYAQLCRAYEIHAY